MPLCGGVPPTPVHFKAFAVAKKLALSKKQETNVLMEVSVVMPCLLRHVLVRDVLVRGQEASVLQS